MKKKISKILRWLRWIILSLILLPVIALLLIKVFGTMKMRKSNDVILGMLSAYPVHTSIDTITIRHRHITYLHTAKEEKKKKDAIVFVHGSPGSLDAFLEYMHHDSLLDRADMIVYDRPGFGHSDFGKTEPSVSGQANVLYHLINHLEYDRYWLIGHSYGGPIIIQTVMDHPSRIAGICIVAGSVIYELEPVASWRKWIDLPLIREILPTAMRVSNEELMALRRDLRMIDDDWDQVRVPVSLIHGTKDMLVPFANLEKAKEKLIHADTVRTLIFEDENHFILWTQIEQIVDEITAFIDDQ